MIELATIDHTSKLRHIAKQLRAIARKYSLDMPPTLAAGFRKAVKVQASEIDEIACDPWAETHHQIGHASPCATKITEPYLGRPQTSCDAPGATSCVFERPSTKGENHE